MSTTTTENEVRTIPEHQLDRLLADLDAAGRQAQARTVAEGRKAKPITTTEGKAFFARIRQEIAEA